MSTTKDIPGKGKVLPGALFLPEFQWERFSFSKVLCIFLCLLASHEWDIDLTPLSSLCVL